ncbi:MAG: permease-like cell division protein FtsX [Actinomycetota bacterium]
MALSLQYVLKETGTNLKRNVFITVAAVMVVTVSLYLVGVVLIASFAVDRTLTLQTRKVEVAVFLNKDVTPSERDSIQKDLIAMPEVGSVDYETKQKAYEAFKVLFRDQPDIVENTTVDALPESFRVKLKDPNEFEVVRDRLEGRPGISQIRDERKFLRRFLAVVRDIRTIGFLVVGLLILSAGVLIATTIRMAIFARRREVAIMKLVGATNWFIRIPFMLEGVIQGVVGTAGAVSLLMITKPVFTRLARSFQFLNLNVSIVEVLEHSAILLLFGVVIGALGSLLGLRRFLEV